MQVAVFLPCDRNVDRGIKQKSLDHVILVKARCGSGIEMT